MLRCHRPGGGLVHEEFQICSRRHGRAWHHRVRIRQCFGHAERPVVGSHERAVVQRGERPLGVRTVSLLVAAQLLLRLVSPVGLALRLASLVVLLPPDGGRAQCPPIGPCRLGSRIRIIAKCRCCRPCIVGTPHSSHPATPGTILLKVRFARNGETSACLRFVPEEISPKPLGSVSPHRSAHPSNLSLHAISPEPSAHV